MGGADGGIGGAGGDGGTKGTKTEIVTHTSLRRLPPVLPPVL